MNTLYVFLWLDSGVPPFLGGDQSRCSRCSVRIDREPTALVGRRAARAKVDLSSGDAPRFLVDDLSAQERGPGLFRLEDDALHYEEQVPAGLEDKARKAAKVCPQLAISLADD